MVPSVPAFGALLLLAMAEHRRLSIAEIGHKASAKWLLRDQRAGQATPAARLQPDLARKRWPSGRTICPATTRRNCRMGDRRLAGPRYAGSTAWRSSCATAGAECVGPNCPATAPTRSPTAARSSARTTLAQRSPGASVSRRGQRTRRRGIGSTLAPDRGPKPPKKKTGRRARRSRRHPADRISPLPTR